MRLINTKTMLLEDFALRQVPQHYAILSHTWTEEEVSYQEYMDQTGETATKQGFSKILETCRLARGDQLDYVWIDTCCIDKTSSAELSEAINSMFRWYKNAWVCYAYLSDFPKISGSCRWFKRGWTLQELIAPSNMRFYDETWTCRGSKRALSNRIQQITNVHPGVLADSSCLAALSIAEKMAWATGRETTRVEDMAYCLLGIFDINMPLLYGEGEKAYTRLQHEIIRHSNDLSIFGWSPSASPLGLEYRAGRRRACPPGIRSHA
ncbi:HET-domain-containing protein [Coniochaeta sp. PMI_546]|nr:HET-domain-containing protein [Coniochaeta sp. PMI_546]